eukprot:TRINITY_DN67937_c0_g1_i1.p1 TRINITY_DN67937_c0_g1~~TRINITY_DN67937_c0_g1_i1.p1  ORF type:complete len:202 (+),score=45.55 TRINITY_DN67937_c0_g1_i1:72-677(+)
MASSCKSMRVLIAVLVLLLGVPIAYMPFMCPEQLPKAMPRSRMTVSSKVKDMGSTLDQNARHQLQSEADTVAFETKFLTFFLASAVGITSVLIPAQPAAAYSYCSDTDKAANGALGGGVMGGLTSALYVYVHTTPAGPIVDTLMMHASAGTLGGAVFGGLTGPAAKSCDEAREKGAKNGFKFAVSLAGLVSSNGGPVPAKG